MKHEPPSKLTCQTQATQSSKKEKTHVPTIGAVKQIYVHIMGTREGLNVFTKAAVREVRKYLVLAYISLSLPSECACVPQ